MKVRSIVSQVAQTSSGSPATATPSWQPLEVFVPAGPFLLREKGALERLLSTQ